VRRLLAWGAGFVGGAAAWKLLSRRVAPVAERDPADELRAKLAESRSLEDDRDEFVAGETPVDMDPEERRRRVHEQGQDALNEMRRRS
jgi:hypothetical protein